MINFDEYKSIGTRRRLCIWIVIMYFERLGVESIPKKIKKFRGNKNITINTSRVDASDSIMCGYFCMGFIDFILEGNLI